MPANTIVIPIKAIYSNGNVTALGELNSGDKLSSDFLNLSSYVANSDFQSFVANTNVAIAAAQGEVSNSYLTSTYVANTSFQSFVANTNSYIAYVAANAGEVSNAYLTSTFTTNTAFQSALANTNAYIATKTGDATALATNTALRTLISDRMQVANVNLLVNDRIQVANLNTTLSDYWPSANVISHVSTELAALVDSAPAALDTLNELAAALGDDANFSTTITNSLATKATWTALTGTNTAIRTLVSDRMQVANVVSYTAKYLEVANSASLGEVSNSYLTSTYTTNTTFQAFVANTNAYIASVSASAGLSNTEVSDIVDSKLQVLDIGDVVGKDGNYGQVLHTNGDGTGYWANTSTAVDLSSVSQSIVPSANVTYDLGSSTKYWRDLYLSGNTIYLGSQTISVNNGVLTLPSSTKVGTSASVANSYLSSTYTTNAVFQSALANTNVYIATKTDDTVALATNTALRTLIDDRMQVANVVSYTAKYLEVANSASLGEVSNSYLTSTYTTNTTFQAFVANTNAAIASAGGEVSNAYLTSTYTTNTAFQSFVANTNAYIATVAAAPSGLSNTEVENIVDSRINVLDLGDVVGTDGNAGQILISYGDGTAYWANNSGGGTVDLSSVSQSIVPSANITYDLGTANNAWRDLYLSGNTIYLAGQAAISVDSSGFLVLPDTAKIGSQSASARFASNTDLTSLSVSVDDRMQVANVTSAISTAIADLVDTAPSTLDTLNELAAALGDDANFAATITTSLAGKASNAAFQSALANTNAYIATKTDDTVVLATNTALRTLISDRMQVANVISYTAKYLEVANSASLGEVSNSYLTSTYTSNAVFQAFVANTNAAIASSSGGLSNSEVSDIVDSKLQVLDLGDVVGTDGNAGQILISYGDGTAYWSNNNPSVDLSGYVTNTAFQSFVANTNAAIANAGEVSNSYLTSTYTSNTTFQSFVANTNAYIATKTGDATVLATNTALRTLISDRVQVANLNSTLSDYWPSANVISYVSGEITSLIDAAPAALDTLNELAAALGDDANFSATVTTSLASKAANSYVNSTFVSNSAFQSFVANTNAYIAASSGSGGLSNTEVSDIVDSKLQVLDIGDVVGTDGGVNQVLLSNGDGTGQWGSAPSGMQEFAFTASNNQTTFTGADNYSSTLSYTAGNLLVFLNGVKLARFDFQANNGTSVVFNDGVAANDYVEFVAF